MLVLRIFATTLPALSSVSAVRGVRTVSAIPGVSTISAVVRMLSAVPYRCPAGAADGHLASTRRRVSAADGSVAAADRFAAAEHRQAASRCLPSADGLGLSCENGHVRNRTIEPCPAVSVERALRCCEGRA